MKFLVKLLASGLGAGFCPLAPGTAGSALGGLIIFLLAPWWNPASALSAAAVIYAAGVALSGPAQNLWGHDSPRIVIDEIAGMFFTMLLIPATPGRLALGFVLFRFLDIVKPPPARQAERLPGGWGVMTDDLVAGLYSCMILWGAGNWI